MQAAFPKERKFRTERGMCNREVVRYVYLLYTSPLWTSRIFAL